MRCFFLPHLSTLDVFLEGLNVHQFLGGDSWVDFGTVVHEEEPANAPHHTQGPEEVESRGPTVQKVGGT